MNEQIAELERIVSSKDQEIQTLQAELSRTRGALESVGQEIQGIRAEQTEQLARSKPEADDQILKDQIATTESTLAKLRESIRILSKAGTSILNDAPNGLEEIHDAIMEVGDPKYKTLLIVLEQGSVRIDELASLLLSDIGNAHEILDELQAVGEVEIKDSHIAIPGKKYREVTIPLDDWKNQDPPEIFDSLENAIGRMSDNEAISKAIESAVDILEQKLARGGALVFQMRKTADTWRKTSGNLEELRYTIKEWKGRAMSLA
jgi:hypothetical protein